MKNSDKKSELRLLGRILDAEVESQNPDMKIVRGCAEKIESSEGRLTEAEIEDKLASIVGSNKNIKTR